MNEFVFDERLFSVMPMAIYFSTVFWFYINWFFFVQVIRQFDLKKTILLDCICQKYNSFQVWARLKFLMEKR